ncbi:MAG: VPLPA-CTERM sorting domain-containing protein [Pseudomonadota bacterium]
MQFRSLIRAFGLIIAAASAQGATLGLTTGAPTVGAVGTADYFEFGPDGDLSLFDGSVSGSSLTTLDEVSADLSFGIGFNLADPETGATGGFSIFDADGLYLAGDLIDLGFRGFRATNSIVELHFGNLVGRGASEWTSTLLMNVIFDGLGEEPFGVFFDGDFFDVEIGMFAVVDDQPPAIPLPAAAWLLLGALGSMVIVRRARGILVCVFKRGSE